MRFFLQWSLFLLLAVTAQAQGTPPVPPPQPAQTSVEAAQGSPPNAPTSTFSKVTALIKKQVNKEIDGNPCPNLANWRPLTFREKFDVFLKHTYSSRTFAAAGVDAARDSIMKSNPEYEQGIRGLGQHYGVELGTNETEVFFDQFLMPSLLKQDPRYFRNPALPFFKRAFYSVSRVVITRADDGHTTYNASRILGGAASQSLADLYVPGSAQGMHPIWNRVTFGLARDAAFNLVHEFWPDVRRKFLHR